MSILRPVLAGALLLLGACSAPVVRPPPAFASESVPSAAMPSPTVLPTPAPAAAPAPAPAIVPVPVPVQMAASMPHVVPAAVATVSPTPLRSNAHAPMAARSETRPVAATTSGTLHVSGHIDLSAGRGQQIEAGELADTLVYFVPASGGGRVRPGQYTVYTHNRDFSPEAISVPLGSTVTFVNLDDVRHNVFSVSPGSAFDLGYQGSGEKISHTFTHAGMVMVGCNVHRSMELDILVVPTPYVGKVAADGSFTLSGLPAGRGILHFWNPRAQMVTRTVTLPMAGPITEKLLAIKPRMDTQLNSGSAP